MASRGRRGGAPAREDEPRREERAEQQAPTPQGPVLPPPPPVDYGVFMQGLVQAMQTQAHTQAALQAQLEAQSCSAFDLTAAHQMGYKLIAGRVTRTLKGQEPDVEEESAEDEESDEDSHLEHMDAQGDAEDVHDAPIPQDAAQDIRDFIAGQMAQMQQLFTTGFDQLNTKVDTLAASQAYIQQQLDQLSKEFHDFRHPTVPGNDDA
ncbi:hypothetical protein Taro_040476 [Colocasia esculenta]|uniref:Uncharacterized protein n=1 Tax=Colocasia esculenta TaxID=4460 RepID=A0A843WIU8_COLES|nr:hypothetical protein [Colocasia esculenta]